MTHRLRIALGTILAAMLVLLLIIVFGDNGLVELNRLQGTHNALLQKNADVTQENLRLYSVINRLQNDPAVVESVARRELGMIRSDELIFKFKSD